VTINVNDQVVWTWVTDFHDTVSDTPGLWNSGVFNTGHMFTNTFTSAGTFPYSCTVHGFAGTVNVQAGNIGPTVAISSPTNGASFTAPAIVSIVATAEDSDGSVTNVSFFDGSTLLGGTNNTPYTITADLPIGSHADCRGDGQRRLSTIHRREWTVVPPARQRDHHKSGGQRHVEQPASVTV
jgi:hypothetical protein